MSRVELQRFGDWLRSANDSGQTKRGWTTNNYYFADGNGNVTYMLDNSQTMVASYRYDPFGNTISSSGSLASTNVYRFSSKEIHANSGMYYYGCRFYDPNLQRWINRDPIAELGFALLAIVTPTFEPTGPVTEDQGDIDLYSFVANDPTMIIDILGLKWTKWLPWNWPWNKILPPYPNPFPDGGSKIFPPWHIGRCRISPFTDLNFSNPPGTLPFAGHGKSLNGGSVGVDW